MRVLVTGSSGQLGAELVKSLSATCEVFGLDLAPSMTTTHRGTVTDRELVFSVVKGMDAVIHTASLHARHLKSHSQSEFVQVNVQGTLNLLEAAVELGVKRFVYTSTTSLYGHAMVPKGEAVWVTEDLAPQPLDIYDVTKIAAEGLCRITAERAGLPCISLRVARFFREPENVLAIYRLYRGVDVRDAAEAHRLALESDLPGFEVFNISAHSPFSREETVDLYQDARKVLIRHYPSIQDTFTRRGWTLPERIDRVYVTEKTERMLGYRPKYNFKETFLEIT